MNEFLYGRALRYAYGLRRRRLFALLAVLLDGDLRWIRAKLLALRGTRQPRLEP